MVREIYENELKDLLELYLHLHESTISEMSEYLSKTWNCVFSTAGHAIDSEQRGQGLEIALPITVGDNVWIGTNVFVLPGVTIGNMTATSSSDCSQNTVLAPSSWNSLKRWQSSKPANP